MRKQLAADLFLIRGRELGDLRNGLFECSDHECNRDIPAYSGRKLERAKGIEPSYAAWEASLSQAKTKG